MGDGKYDISWMICYVGESKKYFFSFTKPLFYLDGKVNRKCLVVDGVQIGRNINEWSQLL